MTTAGGATWPETGRKRQVSLKRLYPETEWRHLQMRVSLSKVCVRLISGEEKMNVWLEKRL
jgi:hypothetical protein